MLWCHPTALPPTAGFYSCFRPPEGRRTLKVLWSAFRCSVSQHSNQFLVPGQTECWGWQVLRWVCSLASSQRPMTAHCSGQIPEILAHY
jgi:hypothetical protein